MDDWARRFAEGDARALARAATGIENRDPRSRAAAARIAAAQPGARS